MNQTDWWFAEILILWLAIVATTVAFFSRSKVAGGLILPCSELGQLKACLASLSGV
ncbi:hypothetical protein Pla8534_01390 [Lignipirellula cremea]|uniref:Uncharacterized protein n=1 Tax=Lignipirellula cremea TaxID=2528010 RepID=A0A518DKM9_9BACT|nr:hypothetical protein Pla8534_01390 [Lignipirellula cremea]